MITRNTVFILGAGSSKPYGYPLGDELVRNIIQQSSWKTSYKELNTVNIGKRRQLQWEIEKFVEHLRASRPKSIDAFLTRVPRYGMLGKYAIAYIIQECNHTQKLDEPPKRNKEESEDLRWAKWDDWHAYLFDTIMNAKNLEDFKQNKVHFLTFNYDFSFDRALANYIRFGFEGTGTQKLDAWEKYKPIHLHGSIFPNFHFDTQDRNPEELIREQCVVFSQCQINEIAEKYIKIISDEESKNQYDKALTVLENAQLLVFLGFGFHPEIMNRLKPHIELWLNKSGVHGIGATCYGMTDSERILSIDQQLPTNYADYRYHRNSTLKCRDWLRVHSNLFDSSQKWLGKDVYYARYTS